MNSPPGLSIDKKESAASGIYLRKANMDDMDLLFRWANDDSVRENAFNTHKINCNEHEKWFLEKLTSDKSVIYICIYGQTPIGQVRLDIDDGDGLISYSIDSAYRLQGHGSVLLSLLEVTVKNDFPSIKGLTARVKKTNIASLRVFEKLLYQRDEKDEYIEFKKATGNAPLEIPDNSREG